jgi:DNA gyrase/topoisomerase IV subunit A
VIDACLALLEDPELTIQDLMQIVSCTNFPPAR